MEMNKTRSWPKRDTYQGATQGDLEGGVPEGTGTMIFANFPFTGDMYEGEFENGKRHGPGMYIFANQVRYQINEQTRKKRPLI